VKIKIAVKSSESDSDLVFIGVKLFATLAITLLGKLLVTRPDSVQNTDKRDQSTKLRLQSQDERTRRSRAPTQTNNPPIKVGFFIMQGSDNVALYTTPCPRVTLPTCPLNLNRLNFTTTSCESYTECTDTD